MALGPGKYDPECTKLQQDLKADGVLLIVLGGERGGGFSFNGTLPVIATLPDLLRHVATEIEKSFPRA